MNYWLARNGQKYGPYSLEDLRRMVAEGSISPTDLAWHEGMLNWASLAEIVPLSTSPPPPPPPQAPPVPAAWNPPPPQLPNAGAYPPSGYGYAAQPLTPPDLHWALVLLFGCVTLGFFLIAWYFVEANFARKIDRQSHAILLGILAYGACFISGIVQAVAQAGDEASSGLSVFGGLLEIAGLVLFFVAVFNIRKSLVDYYNRIEPISLRLSGVMTFFFNIYYFQYHFSRIAAWKKTGRLVPQ